MQASPSVRLQTAKEELFNGWSHGTAALLSAIAIPFLIIRGLDDSTSAAVGGGVFGLSMLVLYLASTLYHFWPKGVVKDRLHIFDHAAIYLLIAGTYTPFTLGVLSGLYGWILFGLVWTLAVAGIFLKLFVGTKHPRISLTIYLCMGWLVLLVAKPIYEAMELAGLLWLLAGGLFYSVGTFFYVRKSVVYTHFIWHLFVVAGSACHFVAVYLYAY